MLKGVLCWTFWRRVRENPMFENPGEPVQDAVFVAMFAGGCVTYGDINSAVKYVVGEALIEPVWDVVGAGSDVDSIHVEELFRNYGVSYGV